MIKIIVDRDQSIQILQFQYHKPLAVTHGKNDGDSGVQHEQPQTYAFLLTTIRQALPARIAAHSVKIHESRMC